MGQPVSVIEKTSAQPGILRFETNRALTGMGHERYAAGTEVEGDRPPDVLARRLLECGGIESVHIYGNIITIELEARRADADDLRDVIADLYTFYRPGVEVAVVEG